MNEDQAFSLRSLLMSSALQRLAGALALIAGLWLAVAWALGEVG